MASMILTIIQKTSTLIWACQGRLTANKEFPDGDGQLPVRTQHSRRAFGHKKRNIITTLLDLTLFIVSRVSGERVSGLVTVMRDN